MSSYEHLDELVKEYLVFRRFHNSLKAFESELKTEKEKGFRADRMLELLTGLITAHDLTGVREIWAHLDTHLFAKMDASTAQMATVHKLETSVLKLYLVNCVQNKRQDKVREFFEKLSAELQGQSEWKDWFALPFLPNPESQPTFSQFFSRQWQDTLMLSLFNLFSILFAALPPPRLADFHSATSQVRKLREENDTMKRTLVTLENLLRRKHQLTLQDVTCPEVLPPQEVMDDFFTIAQEAPSEESQVKTLKSFLRTFTGGGGSAAPASSQQSHSLGDKQKSSSSSSSVRKSLPPVSSQPIPKTRSSSKTRLASSSSHAPVKRLSVTSSSAAAAALKSSSPISSKPEDAVPVLSTFLLLGQEEYSEHTSEVTHCKFSSTGYVITSGDVDGVIKVWSSSPSPQTMATFISQSGGISALDWVPNSERHFLYGTTSGVVRLCDKNEKRTNWEFVLDAKINTLACSPNAAFCVVATQETLKLFDLKTLSLEHDLISEATPVTSELTSCAFNHNSQMVVAAGVDGKARIFDLRMRDCISSWSVSDGCAVTSLVLSHDETAIYALSEDGHFSSWSMYQSGQRFFDHALDDPSFFQARNGSKSPLTTAWGKQFALSGDGLNILTCSAQGGVIYELNNSGEKFSKVLGLQGHKTHTTSADWSMATDCGPCITGGSDGSIRISTLLSE